MNNPDENGPKHTFTETVKETLFEPLRTPFSSTPEQRAEGHRVNPTKIVEAVIIGAISAICAYVFTIPKLEQKIENMNTNMLEMKGQMSEMRHDFYAPIHKSADVPTKHDGNHNGS